MQISEQQQQALEHGEAVPVVIGETQCVVLRRDVYERVRKVLEYDDSEWSDEEMRLLATRTFEDADAAEPIE